MTLNSIEPRHRAGPLRNAQHSAALALLLALAACTTTPPPPSPTVRPAPAAAQPTPLPPVAVVTPPPVVVITPPAPAAPTAPPEPLVVAPPPAQEPVQIAAATSARDYRSYGANHLYQRHRDRVFKGKLPPLLYAVGVLNVAIDSRGAVRKIEWMREPKHAPEVVAEIERMVRAAAPFPAPVRMGGVIYTDVWLWDKSGRFQLDTLTEGQLSALPPSTPASNSPVKSVAERKRPPAKTATAP